jgi:predicted nucleotidyltransferase
MKNRYNLLVLKALEFFIKNPYEEIHLREFARKQGISINSSQRFLNLFLNEGFVKEKRKANLRYFQANLDSLVFRYIKKTYSINNLIKSGLIEYLKSHNCTFAVLFGSMAKGEDDSKSDIDLLCIGAKNLGTREFELILGREINSHCFTLSEWRAQKNKNKAFYQDVIANGLNLIGQMPIL